MPRVLTEVNPANLTDTTLLVGFGFSLSQVAALSLREFTQLIYLTGDL